jgi:dsRNA-specific ribonuclease
MYREQKVVEKCQGVRGTAFIKLLSDILYMGNISDVTQVLTEKGLSVYDMAFTHKSYDVEHNYEPYEFVGDSIANKSVVYYIYTKYPYLQQPKCVVILNKIKNQLISSKSFARFANQLGFWEFISTNSVIRESRLISILEDVFEAFIGATELIVDEVYGRGVGMVVCSTIITKLLDRIEIPTTYEELCDAKTRLKELVDQYRTELKIIYKSTIIEKKHHVEIHFRNQVIGDGSEYVKVKAEQIAAKKAIRYLAWKGYSKDVPLKYIEFNRSIGNRSRR